MTETETLSTPPSAMTPMPYRIRSRVPENRDGRHCASNWTAPWTLPMRLDEPHWRAGLPSTQTGQPAAVLPPAHQSTGDPDCGYLQKRRA